MRPKGDCIWMIGDNPVNDIRGAREKINAVVLQKIHAGVEVGSGINTPDAAFTDFVELRKILAKLRAEQLLT
jgi:putative hydrolase of the HAD superfamily